MRYEKDKNGRKLDNTHIFGTCARANAKHIRNQTLMVKPRRTALDYRWTQIFWFVKICFRHYEQRTSQEKFPTLFDSDTSWVIKLIDEKLFIVWWDKGWAVSNELRKCGTKNNMCWRHEMNPPLRRPEVDDVHNHNMMMNIFSSTDPWQ